MKILIKPLTVNRAYQGRRFRTKLYDEFEYELGILLDRNYKVPPGAKLSVSYKFGLSSKNADIDNPVKPTQDVLQKMYGFNDKNIFKMTVEKEIVPKGQEYIEFDLQVIP